MEAPLHLCWEGEITDDEAPRGMDDSQSSQQSSAPDDLEATTALEVPSTPPPAVPTVVAIVPGRTLTSVRATILAGHIENNLGGTAHVVSTGKSKLGPPPAGTTHIATGYPCRATLASCLAPVPAWAAVLKTAVVVSAKWVKDSNTAGRFLDPSAGHLLPQGACAEDSTEGASSSSSSSSSSAAFSSRKRARPGAGDDSDDADAKRECAPAAPLGLTADEKAARKKGMAPFKAFDASWLRAERNKKSLEAKVKHGRFLDPDVQREAAQEIRRRCAAHRAEMSKYNSGGNSGGGGGGGGGSSGGGGQQRPRSRYAFELSGNK